MSMLSSTAEGQFLSTFSNTN